MQYVQVRVEGLKQLVRQNEITKTSHYGKQPNQESRLGTLHGVQEGLAGISNVLQCPWITLVNNSIFTVVGMT